MESQPLLEEGEVKKNVNIQCSLKAVGDMHGLFVSWLTPLLELALEKPLELNDLFQLRPGSRSHAIALRFKRFWGPEKQKKCPRVWWSLLRAFGSHFILAGVMKLMADVLQFVPAMVLCALLTFLAHPTAPATQGYMYVGIFLVAGVLQSVFLRKYVSHAAEMSMNVKSSLTAAVYEKALHLSLQARQRTSSAHITSLLSVDIQRLHDVIPYLHALWYAILQIAISSYLIYSFLGIAYAATLMSIALLLPLTTCISHVTKSAQIQLLSLQSKRNQAYLEIFSALKVDIKLLAREEQCLTSLDEMRAIEMNQLEAYSRLRSLASALIDSVPTCMALATFVFYAVWGSLNDPLPLSIALPCIMLFHILRIPLFLLPQLVNTIVEASRSLDSITTFLTEEDQRKLPCGNLTKIGIRFENATLCWQIVPVVESESSYSMASSASSPWHMRNIDLDVGAGELCAIIGPAGSGKSTLLNSILNEVHCTTGRIFARGTLAYIAQCPFLRHTSIRENVLFGKAFDASWYACVMDVTGLTSLVLENHAVFPCHDDTHIQAIPSFVDPSLHVRIALARAVYQNADIYLLDDIFATMDKPTREFIFERCLRGLLRRKCIVWVTDALEFIDACDSVALVEDGEIVEQGSITTVLASNGPVVKMMQNSTEKFQPLLKRMTSDFISPDPTPIHHIYMHDPAPKSNMKDVAAYYLNVCGGFLPTLALSLLYIITQVCGFSGIIWLGYATSTWSFIYIFVGINGAYMCLLYARATCACEFTSNGSRFFFSSVSWSLLRAPLSYYKSNELNTLLPDLFKDFYIVDCELPVTVHMYVSTMISVILSTVLIMTAIPLFMIVIIPSVVVFYLFQRAFVPTVNALHILENTSQDDMMSYVKECLLGLRSLHAYRIEGHCIANYHRLIDNHQRARILTTASNHWLATRVEWLGILLGSIAAILAVNNKANDSILNPVVAVALFYAFNLASNSTWSVHVYRQLQSQETSVVELQKLHSIDNEGDLRRSCSANTSETGALIFENAQLKYPMAHQPALSRVSFTIAPHEKIGIVGSVGSGKSSLIAALLRLYEIDAGSISLDGVDINTMGLHDLRKKVVCIPQDPTLFSGTIRTNLDPSHIHGDDQLWAALKRAQLVPCIESLDERVDERGANFTAVERRLLWCARIWLQNASIVYMDESATTSWTCQELERHQAMLEECSGRTLLIVARHINTLLSCSRILVMDEGRVVAFDTPHQVMETPCAAMATFMKRWAEEQPMT
ncbi:hypothetical protein THRCLA_03410 [Thraustotheca clavata]|uniref:ATP-binding Cassette (ABC) Superfamily n=1 Tax=Thraustotheca clavata TaxID=74557 RepID=A0A1W0A2B4_9STRA|nr:hypothetical protein THRCLA_03410 [Thraustotheca clavata]